MMASLCNINKFYSSYISQLFACSIDFRVGDQKLMKIRAFLGLTAHRGQEMEWDYLAGFPLPVAQS
jgi:hypothetical protein